MDCLHFLQMILDQIGPGTPDRWFCFLCNNSRAHQHTAVVAMILLAGHWLMFRPLYDPWGSPIEFCFDTVNLELALRASA